MNNTNAAVRKSKTAFTTFAIACALTGIAALTPSVAAAQVWGGGDFGVAPPFAFNQARPRLVVLIHGITPKPSESPEIGIGKSKHARYYWGFDFVKGVQGRVSENGTRVITPRKDGKMQLQTVLREDWQHFSSWGDDDELAPIFSPISWNTQLPSGIEFDQTLIKQHINLMTKGGAESTMVMVNTRDGSKHLMIQLAEFIDEIYTSYRAAFGHLEEKQQPQIYLVGHSFGGVIARALLANPTSPDLFGNKLTATQRTRADYLRERVVLVKTLSTPHEGSPAIKVGTDAATYMETVGSTLIATYCAAVAALPWKSYDADWVRNEHKKMLTGAMNAISGQRDCLKDITRIAEYNSGILKPDTARRRAGGDMVPIYTAAGRNPGGMYYDSSRSVFAFGGGEYNPISNLDMARLSGRFSGEATALTIIESVMRNQGYGKAQQMPWGKATWAEGDRVRSPLAGQGSALRPSNATLASTLTSDSIKYVAAKFFEGGAYRELNADGEWDNDGFVGFDSSHGLNLNTNWYRVVDQAKYGGWMPWDVDNHGSMMWNVGNGLWIHNELVRGAGPIVTPTGSRRSVWMPGESQASPKNGIRIQVTELKDVNNDLDTLTKADFSIKIRVGSIERTTQCPENTQVVTNIPVMDVYNYPSPVIPIKIDVWERDSHTFPYDPDDTCVVSPMTNKTSLYLYYDVRTNRVAGDLSGDGGTSLTAVQRAQIANKVSMTLKVTRIQ